jgi:hypothetical protein
MLINYFMIFELSNQIINIVYDDSSNYKSK